MADEKANRVSARESWSAASLARPKGVGTEIGAVGSQGSKLFRLTPNAPHLAIRLPLRPRKRGSAPRVSQLFTFHLALFLFLPASPQPSVVPKLSRGRAKRLVRIRTIRRGSVLSFGPDRENLFR